MPGPSQGAASGAIAILGLKNGHRFDFNQQVRAAQNGLDASGCGQGNQALVLEELGADLVEGGVVALDVAKVARGADDILPSGAFGFQQGGDVLISPPCLGSKIPQVDAV